MATPNPVGSNPTVVPSSSADRGNQPRPAASSSSTTSSITTASGDQHLSSSTSRRNPSGPKFEGATAELKGYVFEMHSAPTQYPRTLEQLQLYAGTHYTSSPEMASLFDDPPTKPSIATPPADPTSTHTDGQTITTFDQKLFETQVKAYHDRDHALRGHLRAFFLVVHGQCDTVLKSYLQGLADFKTKRLAGDCVWLLKEIRGLISKFDDTHYVHDAIHVTFCKFYGLHQSNKSTTDYYNAFRDAVNTLNLNHAWSLPPKEMNPDVALQGNTDDETRQNLREAQLACHFILNADNKRFGTLKSDLRTAFSRRTNQWPTTLEDAYRLLLVTESHLSQATSSTSSSTRSGQRIRGHQYQQVAQLPADLPATAVLLDTLATHSLFRDDQPLRDLQRVSPGLALQTQAGLFHADHLGSLSLDASVAIPVWHSPHAIANVLALRDLTPHFRVTMDTAESPTILVHRASGAAFRFDPAPNGL